MNIGMPLRTIIVEPLEPPVNDTNIEHEPEHEPLEPEPDQVPASVMNIPDCVSLIVA